MVARLSQLVESAERDKLAVIRARDIDGQSLIHQLGARKLSCAMPPQECHLICGTVPKPLQPDGPQ